MEVIFPQLAGSDVKRLFSKTLSGRVVILPHGAFKAVSLLSENALLPREATLPQESGKEVI